MPNQISYDENGKPEWFKGESQHETEPPYLPIYDFLMVGEYGITLVHPESLEYLSAKAHKWILDQLQEGYRAALLREIVNNIPQLTEDAVWVFPTKPHDIHKSGHCVYFAKCNARPGEIKIGRTNNLASRRQALRREYGRDLNFLAFVKTPHDKELERALHIYFGKAWVASGKIPMSSLNGFTKSL